MHNLNNYRLQLGANEYVPILQGGMGVDISTSELALKIASLGGIGHISDAMSPYLSDRDFKTRFQSSKQKKFKIFEDSMDKSQVKWDYENVYAASLKFIQATMEKKKGHGGVFINVMEKLTMGNPQETLQARLNAAMDAGIDGITLSAGLHNGTLKLAEDNPRFRDVKFGIIVSSYRALKIFLRSADRVNRSPDYIIVEGPLAGGHLGFGEDWKKHELKTIVKEVLDFLKSENLNIPVIPAGGIFTGSDAVDYIKMGAGGVQLATRFTIAQECGLPENVKQVYLNSNEDDVEVNFSSPTGYPMRMLKSSPSLRSNIKPNCEALGYILDKNGQCQYHQAWEKTGFDASGKKLPVKDKMCICYHFMKYDCYTCGHNVYRLKDTTIQLANGEFYLPTAEHIFNDYLYSSDHKINLPEINEATQTGTYGSRLIATP